VNKVLGYHEQGIYFHDCCICGKVCEIENNQEEQKNWVKLKGLLGVDRDRMLQQLSDAHVYSSTGMCPDCLAEYWRVKISE